MNVRGHLRTSDLAQAALISVQQVRNYEASGLIPPAERSPAGYRHYTPKHLAALHAARILIGGASWPTAGAIMQGVHQGELAAALALIDQHHAELASQRRQIEQTLAALSMLAAQPAPPAGARAPITPHSAPLRVGEAARQVGVRVSALRFWEQQGLLLPARDRPSRYRSYDEQQMRRLHVVALLRGAGYDFDAIRATLDALAAGRPEQAIAAAERRRDELTRASWTCLAAMSELQRYVAEFWPELCAAL
jgi:DNA-binding transcriptional MerR regulator